MGNLWEAQIAHPWMNGPLNMAQLTLGCALGHAERNPAANWRDARPKLSTWFEAFAKRPSFQATAATAQH
jgi:glutathione S-transferase